jgi:hypothetical protein
MGSLEETRICLLLLLLLLLLLRLQMGGGPDAHQVPHHRTRTRVLREHALRTAQPFNH